MLPPKNGPQTTLLIGVRLVKGSTSKPAAVAAADALAVEHVAAQAFLASGAFQCGRA
jgi:hypothetical protein